MNEQALALVDRTELLKDEKADRAELNALAGGKYSYTTYALMLVDALNIKVNASIDVTNDPDSTKNGSYNYDGSVFTKSEYDPLTQSMEYSDELHQEALNTVNHLGTFPDIENSEFDYAIADAVGNVALGIKKTVTSVSQMLRLKI